MKKDKFKLVFIIIFPELILDNSGTSFADIHILLALLIKSILCLSLGAQKPAAIFALLMIIPLPPLS